jgi:hypothetical protein
MLGVILCIFANKAHLQTHIPKPVGNRNLPWPLLGDCLIGFNKNITLQMVVKQAVLSEIQLRYINDPF